MHTDVKWANKNQIYATFYTQISHFILFTVKIFPRNWIFLLQIKITEHNKKKLEWGCPNGTKYRRGNQFKLPKLCARNHFT